MTPQDSQRHLDWIEYRNLVINRVAPQLKNKKDNKILDEVLLNLENAYKHGWWKARERDLEGTLL